MGLGKSALAQMVAERVGARLILEQQHDHPFLERFNADPAQWALQRQLAFLTNRFKQQRTMRSLDLFHQGMVADYTFDKDRIFAELALTGEDLDLYDRLYMQMEPVTPRPDLVVFLHASLDRILRGLRDKEQVVDIDQDYLAQVQHAYAEYFFRYTKSPLLIINADEMDCVRNRDDFTELLYYLTECDHHGITYVRPAQLQLSLFS